jgi:4'-phosphopantetheinyl transferase
MSQIGLALPISSARRGEASRFRTTFCVSAAEVHVWRLQFSSAESAEAGWYVMTDEERARAESFRFASDRKRFCQSKLLLRRVLGKYLGLDPGKVPIVADQHGKPFVDGMTSPRGLQFNLTHSRSVALLAITTGQTVGIDVEDISRVANIEVSTLAEGVLSKREIEAIMVLERESQMRAFLRCWTRKEALLKAVGVGLLGKLDGLEVPWDCSKKWNVQWQPDCLSREQTFQMADLSFGDHFAAIAAPVISGSIQLFNFHKSELYPDFPPTENVRI